MSKTKTHKGLLKRVKVTASGKITHKLSGSSHLMASKNGKKVRQLRRGLACSTATAKRLGKMLNVRAKGRDQTA